MHIFNVECTYSNFADLDIIKENTTLVKKLDTFLIITNYMKIYEYQNKYIILKQKMDKLGKAQSQMNN